jgi:L-ascorbate metabolism protein UlaG (beta-lactamase superfamily)
MKKNSLAGYLLCGAALSVMLAACGDEEVAETDVSHEEIVMYETPGSEALEENVSGTQEQTVSEAPEETPADTETGAADTQKAGDDQPSSTEEKEETEMKDPVLLYMGHASLRIVTGEDKVIYIDPFAGDAYDMTADLILQTHDHYDHKDMSKISSRSSDCVVITQKEALKGGEHQSFDEGYVQVEAVEAGYNKNHDKKNCVGYILTFSNGATLYVSGDTSKTDQMPELAARNLDYAFFCCDGVFNMDAAEASECASLVGAKVSIPYHTGSASETIFDEANVARFTAPGAYILKPGEELVLKKGQ